MSGHLKDWINRILSCVWWYLVGISAKAILYLSKLNNWPILCFGISVTMYNILSSTIQLFTATINQHHRPLACWDRVLSNQQYDSICPNDWRWPKSEGSLLMTRLWIHGTSSPPPLLYFMMIKSYANTVTIRQPHPFQITHLVIYE